MADNTTKQEQQEPVDSERTEPEGLPVATHVRAGLSLNINVNLNDVTHGNDWEYRKLQYFPPF